MKPKKKLVLIILAAVILIAVLMIGFLSISNLAAFFATGDNMVVQVFEETDQGTVERLKVDLHPDSRGYKDIKAQIEAHTYFLANQQSVGTPRNGDLRAWIYMATGAADMTATQLLMIANDGTILFTDAAGTSKSAAVLSGSSCKDLYQAIANIIGY